MKTYTYEAKTKEEAIKLAEHDQKTSQENLVIKLLEEKQGLLKKQVKIEVINVNDLIDFLKESLNEITNLMNISINLEVRRRDNNIDINIFSDNNSILIGTNGKTLNALQNILRQIIYPYCKDEFRISLDIENYKDKKITRIERVAKQVAREVVRTKIEASLEPMNSYERRVVHNALSKNKYVYTESIGEEPNRYIVIKLKETND